MAVHPFKTAIEARDVDGVTAAFTEDAVLHSPVFFRPVEGRERVIQALLIVDQVLGDLEYVGEFADGSTVGLRFHARVGELELEGLDLLTLNEDRLVKDLTVFMRPFKAVEAFREGMMAKVEEFTAA